MELLNAGYDVVVADNLVNAGEEAVRRVERITGKAVPFVRAELCHADEVEALFARYPGIGAVIHFAGLKAVGESVAKPLEYYSNNLVPYIAKAAAGQLEKIHVYGNDYPALDGTAPRRPGDIAACCADPARAREELGWEARYDIGEMCASSWKWQSGNPNGYKG